jgi:hypothetical protein
MRIAKVLPLVPIFVLTVAGSLLSAIQLPRCSASAPCFTIANRQGSAGLALKSLSVASVYLNGRLLTKGLGADYYVETVAHDKIMVIVLMPANTTGKPEIFQVIAK